MKLGCVDREVEQVTERLTEIYPCNKCNVEFCSRQCYSMTRWAESAKEKLAEYETAEEEGRLVVLPCSIGDTVWVTTHPFNVIGDTVWVTTHPFNVFDDFDFYTEAQDEIYESYISSITFYENSNQYRIHAKETRQFIKAYFMESDFGKTVFLTKEEAEKALKEMESDN